MLLAIDVGNTNTVLGLYRLAPAGASTRLGLVGKDGPALLADWRVSTPRSVTVDEVGIILRDLFSLRSFTLTDVTGVVVSSVVPPIDSTLRRALELYCKVKPLFVEPGVRTGVPILTDNPSEVGADRIVNCVAAHELFKSSTNALSSRSAAGAAGERQTEGSASPNTAPHPHIIVVDLGTATTFDVVSPRGEYLGGAIAPGLGISADALFARAARLPRIDIRKPAKIIGTNTVDHLQIGLYYGYIGLVDGILERMLAELGPETKIVATGGLARLIAGGSKYISQVDEWLTLTGLRLIYERNQDRSADRNPARNPDRNQDARPAPRPSPKSTPSS